MSSKEDAVAVDPLATSGHTDGTKARLKSMTEGLDEFSHLLRTGTRQRKEKDDHRVAELKAEMATVERTISMEVDKRVEMAKALQVWADTQVTGLRNRLEASVTASKLDIEGKVLEIRSRIGRLETSFEADRIRVMEDVRRRNEELVASLREFNAAFEADRAARMEREQFILERIAKQEHESIRRFDEERQVREQIYLATKKRLEDAVAARTKTDDKFQTSVLAEVAAVKNALAAEESKRIAEDDEIAESLNRYVQKLQASLALMLSDDTSPA